MGAFTPAHILSALMCILILNPHLFVRGPFRYIFVLFVFLASLFSFMEIYTSPEETGREGVLEFLNTIIQRLIKGMYGTEPSGNHLFSLPSALYFVVLFSYVVGGSFVELVAYLVLFSFPFPIRTLRDLREKPTSFE